MNIEIAWSSIERLATELQGREPSWQVQVDTHKGLRELLIGIPSVGACTISLSSEGALYTRAFDEKGDLFFNGQSIQSESDLAEAVDKAIEACRAGRS